MKSFVFSIVFLSYLFSGYRVFAQQITISGKVIDSATAKPLPEASIFIANSTLSAKSDSNGCYAFKNIKPGTYAIVISYVGYASKQIEIEADKNIKVPDVFLPVRSESLKEVIIKPDANRSRYLDWFKTYFLGNSPDAYKCKILNDGVLNLDVDQQNNRLTASCDEFLTIENNALGYRMKFLIREYWYSFRNRNFHFKGSVIFEDLQGSNSEQKRWANERAKVYAGSFREFLSCLAQGNYTENDFVIRRLVRTINPKRPSDSLINVKRRIFSKLAEKNKKYQDSVEQWSGYLQLPRILEHLGKDTVNRTTLVSQGTFPDSYNLTFTGYLYVIYKGKKAFEENLYRPSEIGNYQVSAISLLRKGPVIFSKDGLLLTPDSIFYEGAWSSGVAELLPFDYTPLQNKH